MLWLIIELAFIIASLVTMIIGCINGNLDLIMTGIGIAVISISYAGLLKAARDD